MKIIHTPIRAMASARRSYALYKCLMLIGLLLVAFTQSGWAQQIPVLPRQAQVPQTQNGYFYYGPKGEKVALKPSNDHMLVKVRDGLSVNEQIALFRDRSFRGLPTTLAPQGQAKAPLMANLAGIRSAGQLGNLVLNLKKNPLVEYASPFFETEDGTLNGVNDEFIVKLFTATDLPKLEQLARETNTVISQQNEFFPEIYVLKATPSSAGDALQMANFFYESGLFKFAEPNFVRVTAQNPPLPVNDPFFPLQWYIRNEGPSATFPGATPDADIDADEAWPFSTGTGIRVAIIDEGVDVTHPDLAANIVGGFDPTDRNGLDGPPGSPFSAQNDAHGTGCAGLVAAVANNGIGLAGVAYDAKIIPIRFAYGVGDGSGRLVTNTVWVFNSYVWAILPEELGGGAADILNNSYTLGTPSALVEEAIFYVNTLGRGGKGSVFIASAGNSNVPRLGYPASSAGAISVGASTMCDTRKTPGDCSGLNWGSSYGPTLDVVAPGVFTVSTDIAGPQGYVAGDYVFFGGTSAAGPVVCGVAALMLAANPDLSATEARYILSTTTDKVGGYTYAPNPNQPFGDWNIEMGYGRVNAYKAVLKSIDAITNPTLLADFQVIQRAFCGLPAEVEFVNTSANAVAARWEFEGGTPSVSTDFSPVVTYANVGLYDVKLTVFGANGDSVVLNRLNFISVDDPLARVSGLPLFADFEDPDALFPDDNWEIFDLDDDDFTWEPAAVGAFGESEGSVFMDNYEYFLAFGELDWILPPSIDLSQVDNRLALLFDYAYAQFLTVEDNLIIAYSIDCETSYQLLDFIPGSDLATAPPTMAPFVPNADQWATRVYDLSAFAAFWKARGAKTLNLALINQSNWGNNLYLDNIEVTTTPPPFADFAASDQNAFCENFAVQFADLSAFADAVAWEFPGGTPATSTARNPVVTYSTPGTYDVTLKAMNEQGESILTREGFIVLGSPVSLPLAYDFETPLPGNWSVFNPDNSETLIRVGPGLGAFEKSNFSGVVPNYSYNGVGQRDGLITPAIDVTGVSTLALAFDYAYTFYQEGNFVLTDGLEVYVSTDECAGASNLANYQLIWSSEGADLATAPATNQPFIPEFYEWKRVTVPLDAYLGTNPLRVAILNKNGFGNNLFIDNILIDREILPTINFLSVVDAETNEIVSPMFSEFELSELPASVNFVANVSEGTTGIGSILMGMRGPGYNRSITENVAPYAMFGDNDGDFNGRTMRAGTFDITLTAFTGANRTGTVAEVFRTSLDIVNFSPFNVTAFRWVDANTNQVVGPLPAIIDLAVTGKDINIIAETSEEVGSVVFRLRGSATVNQTENVAPYALFGDVDGDFNAWGNVKVGTYELTATPYPLARGRGLAGRSLTQIFEVVDSGSGMMAAGLNAGFAPVSFNGLDRMVVYPNPARQLFTLEMPDNARPLKAVRVFDMVGRLHFEETTADNLLGLKLDFPVGQLSPGVYLIRAETDGGAYTFRIVKE